MFGLRANLTRHRYDLGIRYCVQLAGDVLSDGSVWKSVLKPGRGFSMPEDGDIVQIVTATTTAAATTPTPAAGATSLPTSSALKFELQTAGGSMSAKPPAAAAAAEQLAMPSADVLGQWVRTMRAGEVSTFRAVAGSRLSLIHI